MNPANAKTIDAKIELERVPFNSFLGRKEFIRLLEELDLEKFIIPVDLIDEDSKIGGWVNDKYTFVFEINNDPSVSVENASLFINAMELIKHSRPDEFDWVDLVSSDQGNEVPETVVRFWWD